MKKIILIFTTLGCTGQLLGQTGHLGFWDKILISQSMETAEQKEKPAQIQLTIPNKDSSSWLINLGVSYALSKNATTSISKIQAEYNRNTLTDKEQNNAQLGYGLTQALSKNVSKGFFLNADAKYVYDGVGSKHSIASNLLLNYYKDAGAGPGLNFNVNNVYGDVSLFLSLFGGIQLQQVFEAKDDAAKGFIARPQYLPLYILI